MKILLVPYLLYVLTFGPVIWLASRNGLSADDGKSIKQVYGPLIDYAKKKHSLGRCLNWWANIGHEHAWFTLWVLQQKLGPVRNLGVDD